MQPIGPGTRIKDLEVEELLGRGAFARVYRARDVVIGRRIALKLIHTPEESGDTSVLKEARAIGRLNSPNIVTLYDVHRLEDGLYPVVIQMRKPEGKRIDSGGRCKLVDKGFSGKIIGRCCQASV